MALKKAWKIWSDLITLVWLDRLWLKKPCLANVISFFIAGLVCGLISWYYYDPRFRLYPKDSYVELSREARMWHSLIWGTISFFAFSSSAFVMVFNFPSKEQPKKRPSTLEQLPKSIK